MRHTGADCIAASACHACCDTALARVEPSCTYFPRAFQLRHRLALVPRPVCGLVCGEHGAACFSGAAVLLPPLLLCCCASAAAVPHTPIALATVRSAATAHPWAVAPASSKQGAAPAHLLQAPHAPTHLALPCQTQQFAATWHAGTTSHPFISRFPACRSTAAAREWTSTPTATARACTTTSSPILTPVRPNRTAHCSSMCMPSPTWLGLLAASMSGCCIDDD